MAKVTKAKLRKKLRIKHRLGISTVKIADLLNPMFGQALTTLGQKEVEAKTAFAIADIMHQRKEHLLKFEEARKIVCDRFCEKNEDGSLKLTEDKSQYVLADQESYDKEYKALIDLEVEMSTIERAAIDKLSSIKPADVMALLPLIK